MIVSLGEKFGWRRLARQLLVVTRWIEVFRDRVAVPGGELTYTWIDHPGSVFVVPVLRNGHVALIRSYRYTLDEECWEIPAGALHDRNGRSLEEVARAEMFEEAGCTGGDLQPLGDYWCANGLMRLKAHYFVARGVELGPRETEADESVSDVITLPLEEAAQWARDGRISDGESAFAILLAANAISSGS